MSESNNDKTKEIFKNIGGVLQNAFEPINESIRSINQTISEKLSESLREINKTILENMKSLNLPKFDDKDLYEIQRKLSERMIKNGWYYSGILPIDVSEILDLDDEDFNLQLVNFYVEEYEILYNNIMRNFFDRKNILEKCFSAHENKDYELCIPTMLSQADGISKEIFGKYLFYKENGEPATKNQNRISFRLDYWFDIAYYIQLSITGQLNINSNKTDGFNRHKVIHGLNIDYATKENSIRCIVMLNFLAEIKEYFVG